MVKWQNTRLWKEDLVLHPFPNDNIFVMKTKISGKTCPYPGSLPHGNWTCEMQEIPILGTSFLDEDAQSYRGNEFSLHIFRLNYISSPSMPT